MCVVVIDPIGEFYTCCRDRYLTYTREAVTGRTRDTVFYLEKEREKRVPEIPFTPAADTSRLDSDKCAFC